MSKASSVVDLDQAAPLFSALGDRTRLGLLASLSHGGPESITSLSARSDTSRQAITKHLTVLSKVGLVRGTRQGRKHLWRLEPQRLDQARAYLDVISQQWDDALLRLKNLVED